MTEKKVLFAVLLIYIIFFDLFDLTIVRISVGLETYSSKGRLKYPSIDPSA